MRNVTEIQQQLITLKYLPEFNDKGERNADGTFGRVSLDAYNRWRAAQPVPLPPVTKPNMTQLNADLFPEERPAAPTHPNPINDFLLGLAIKAALNKLKGLPQMNFLAGYATVIGGVVSILIGIAGLAGIHPAGAASLDFNASVQLIVTGWAALGLRRAISNMGK